jgi:hypothetical protein
MPTYRTSDAVRSIIPFGQVAVEKDDGYLVKEDDAAFNEKLAKYGADYVSPAIDHLAFARMLAKIGLGYCCLEFGIDDFTPFSTPLILGDTSAYRHFISSTHQKAETPADFEVPAEDRYHHEMYHKVSSTGLICVRIDLFVNFKAPSYYVMSGIKGKGVTLRASFPNS